MDYADALEAAKAAWFDPEISDQFTIDGETVYGHIENSEGFVRDRHSVSSIAFTARIPQSSFATKPPVDKLITYAGVQYRVGEDVHPSGGDWIIPLIESYIEV
jgi:hypothetical protein